MSSLIFLDVLAYAGAAMAVLAMVYIGLLLLRPASAISGLAAFIGESRARQCLQDGSFKPGQARAIGSLLLLFATFIAACIVRGMLHA